MNLIRHTVIAMVGLAPFVAAAQGTCVVDADTREGKMLAFFAAPLAFSPAGNVGALGKGDVRLGFDITYVPTPSADIRRPEKCYNNQKTENTELSPIFPRPRLTIGLGNGVAVEATYLPPVTVLDATPNLFAAALSYARPLSGQAGLLLRAHTTLGSVKGPITCSSEVIQTTNASGLCYARQPSEDKYTPTMVGVEAALTMNGAKGSAYAGAGYTSLKPRFQVGFTDANNVLDDTKIEVDLSRMALFAGGAYHLSPRIALTTEVYSVPKDVTTIRFGGSWTVRQTGKR